MVNNETDLKLAKQEVAVMVRGGKGGRRLGEKGRGRKRHCVQVSPQARQLRGKRAGKRTHVSDMNWSVMSSWVDQGSQLMPASVGSSHTICHHTSCDVRSGCTGGVSLVLPCREYLATTATQ